MADETTIFNRLTPEERECAGDELGVALFAVQMRRKMEFKAEQGKQGWYDNCTIASLWQLLEEHVAKRDPVDIANFAMMIWNRSGDLE